MLEVQCEINFASGRVAPINPASKLVEKVVGTGGNLTWESEGRYRVEGPPAGQNIRALFTNNKKWQPVVTGSPLQGWAGGVFDFLGWPSNLDYFTFSHWCLSDAGRTVGTLHPAGVGVSKVGADWFFAVFRDNEYANPSGRVVGTVPLSLDQQYIWTQTCLLVPSGVVAEGWVYDMAGVETDHVAIEGNMIGQEFQYIVKLGAYNGFAYEGTVFRIYEYWFAAGNEPHPGPRRVP
jgi:hypothetical protein